MDKAKIGKIYAKLGENHPLSGESPNPEFGEPDSTPFKRLLKPVGLYNRKAENLKAMCRQLIERHDGKVPDNKEELIKLKDVGGKSADIMLNLTFGKDTIAVDTHVHRVLNGTGMVDTETRMEPAYEVYRITPEKYRKHTHERLIRHGRGTCTARNPKCRICTINELCGYKDEKLIDPRYGYKRKLLIYEDNGDKILVFNA
jgi:endonuclease-3